MSLVTSIQKQFIQLKLTEFIIYAGLFLAAFLPRVIELGKMLTTDELLWLSRCPAFMQAVLKADWAGTSLAVHPGVTLMWISGTTSTLLWNASLPFGEKLAFASFPVALVTSLGVLAAYFLLKHLIGARIALVSSLLIAMEPFFVAHSRVLQLDALLTTFMLISLLAMLVFLSKGERKFLYLSGVMGGLALLTKFNGLFLVPYLGLLILVGRFDLKVFTSRSQFKDWAIKKCSAISILFLLMAVTFLALWPSIWVNPLSTIDYYLNNVEWATTTPHEMGGFYLGANDGNYDPSFYPVSVIMRISPLTLIFSAVACIYLGISVVKWQVTAKDKLTLAILAYIILFCLQMTIGDKKFDRYMLPIYPCLDILAALGLIISADGIRLLFARFIGKEKLNARSKGKDYGYAAVVAVVIVVGIGLLLSVQPYYLAYFNPLVPGNPGQAGNVLLVGWGEGMDAAAAYLNTKPDAKNLTVAAQYSGFQQYFAGTTVRIDTADQSDYVVFYVNMVQRHYNADIWDAYSKQTPEKIIQINGIDYCWIYETAEVH